MTAIRKPTRSISGWMTPKSSNPKKPPGVAMEFNERNQLVGIEMLYILRRSPQLDFKELQ